MPGFKNLIEEVHRRSLWQVTLIYVGGALVAYQAVQALTEGLGLPQWFPGFAVVLFVIGLPIVVATAFVHEVAPPAATAPELSQTSSRKRTSRLAMKRDDHRFFTWRNAAATFVVALAVWGVVATVWFLSGGEAASKPNEAAVASVDAGWLSLQSDPSNVLATATPVEPASTFVEHQAMALGQTPIADYALPPGEYLIRLESEGTTPLELLVHVASGEHTSVSGHLISPGEDSEGMLLVIGGTYPGAPAGLAVRPFLIDRYEVTNADYLEFVSGGGYENATYWPGTMIIDGAPKQRTEAIGSLVDQTGLPGPRNWSGGLYPEGKSDHPVVGVSWYEAMAYARWSGEELPTWDQWWRAALGDEARPFPWGNDVAAAEIRANFGLVDTEAVGSHPIGASPFGIQDMAGNVQEWLRELEGQPAKAGVVGGSWDAPPYTFDLAQVNSFDPDYASQSIGFRCIKPMQ